MPLNLSLTSHSPGSRPVLLVADDSRANCLILEEILGQEYEVLSVSSGRALIELLALPPQPDLILLDICMPDMNGYQVLGEIRKNPGLRDLPVIFVSSMDGYEDERKALDMGAVDYIIKPVRPHSVLSRVRCQIEFKRTRDLLYKQKVMLASQIEDQIRENQLIQDVSIRALASLAETRDSETGNHILRTQWYVNILCNELARQGRYLEQLGERDIKDITKASPLHDIGKVGIPDSILLKPGPLSQDEWTIMKTHTTLGSHSLGRALGEQSPSESMSVMKRAMEISQSHHERWDGAGYPNGMGETEIPLSARLMALADVFDALVSKRVYKPAFGFVEAVELIHADRGKRFDPWVVDAFFNQQHEFESVARKYADAA